MSAVLEAPTQDLPALRDALRKLTTRQERVATEAERCAADIVRHEATMTAVPEAQAVLVAAHERRAAGVVVTEKQIDAAEIALRKARLLAERADAALKGTRAALAKFEEEAITLNFDAQRLRAETKRAQGAALRARADASRREFRSQCAAFAAGAYAAHHATLTAIQETARELDLLSGLSLPGPVMPIARMVGTATAEDGGDWDFDIEDAIEAKAAPIRKSLAELKL